MVAAIDVKQNYSPRLRCDGRVALVTGGGRGIGRGIALELARTGAQVVIGDLNEQEMAETCRELAPVGKVDWVKLDVSDPDSRLAAVETIRRKHGPVSILVNNAGVAAPGFFADEEARRIDMALAVDLVGAIDLTRLVIPHMIEVGWGRIVNICSMMASTGSPGFAVYSAAKAGLLSFGQAVEREIRRMCRYLRVTAVLPPSVKTRAFEQAKTSEPGMMRWGLVPPVSIEQVARRTVHGLIAGRRYVYCGVQSYLVSLIQRFTPWLMDWILQFMFVGQARQSHPPGARLPAPSA
jgi:NAD(P)-dependent dehydrogenase (short-subunit alcohol dehydrogenase family)